MVRPTLLVVEPEPEQALSTRKLVLETGKFNVLTAHSGPEFMELLRRFPKVDCAIVHGMLKDIRCAEMFAAVKKMNPGMPTILLSAKVHASCKGADHVISSHQPEALLELARNLLGDPQRMR